MKRYVIALAAIAAATAFPAAAQDSAWHTYSKDGKCWASSAPVRSEGGIANRSGQFLSIQNAPSEGVRGSVAMVSGFAASGEGSVTAAVDGETFEVLPFGDAAFAGSGKPEAELVAAMRRGREMTVTWTADGGGTATDVYSLEGFSAAKAETDASCR